MCDLYKTIEFDPDSSPQAWEHYINIYDLEQKPFCDYDFDNLTFFSNKNGKYVKKPQKPYSRLYALSKDCKYNEEKRCFKPPYTRLSGDTDFNFNGNKCKIFKKIIGNNNEALEQLEHCKNMHHNLLNFSIMQTVGNMQKSKRIGISNEKYDRFDSFIYHLDEYYKEAKDKRNDTFIAKNSSKSNRPFLIEYLNTFENLKEYCKKIYFIYDDNLIERLIANGQNPLNYDVMLKYMDLAETYWEVKNEAIKEIIRNQNT